MPAGGPGHQRRGGELRADPAPRALRPQSPLPPCSQGRLRRLMQASAGPRALLTLRGRQTLWLPRPSIRGLLPLRQRRPRAGGRLRVTCVTPPTLCRQLPRLRLRTPALRAALAKWVRCRSRWTARRLASETLVPQRSLVLSSSRLCGPAHPGTWWPPRLRRSSGPWAPRPQMQSWPIGHWLTRWKLRSSWRRFPPNALQGKRSGSPSTTWARLRVLFEASRPKRPVRLMFCAGNAIRLSMVQAEPDGAARRAAPMLRAAATHPPRLLRAGVMRQCSAKGFLVMLVLLRLRSA